MAQRRADWLAGAVAATAAAAACAAGIARGSFAAGGSDSSCYLSAAQLISGGAMSFGEPLAAAAPWRDAATTFLPAGHVVSPAAPATFVPMCPPGLPLVMALFRLVHVSEFLVVPLLGALAVWLAFIVGRRVDRPLTGAAAAVLTATSPIFLYQIVQPMTDVPATAWWLLAVVCALGGPRAFAAGLAAAVALLTRPNLAPLAIVLAGYVAFASARPMQALLRFGAGLLPGAIAIALIQRAMYGGALSTGYGAAAGLFAAGHVLPNLRRYPAWLIGAHTPVLIAALAAPFVARRRDGAWLLLAFAAATLACYLPYVVFDDWWYIRFLLPAIPPLIVLALIPIVAASERWTAGLATPTVCVIVAALTAYQAHLAIDRHAFGFAASERHYVDAGTLAARLPAEAVVITVRNSGSVHYYAGRPVVGWDVLEPRALEPALAFLRSRGRTPYLLLEADEEPVFRGRFESATPIGALDWPPVAQIGRTVRVYDPADRARFLAGARVRTVYVWPERRRRFAPFTGR